LQSRIIQTSEFSRNNSCRAEAGRYFRCCSCGLGLCSASYLPSTSAMSPSLYRLAIYASALASLGACGRATYQFAAPAACLPAEVVAPPPCATALAEAPRPARNAPALMLPRQPSRPALPPTANPKRLRQPPQAILTQLAARRAPLRTANTAGSAPYFSGSWFYALIAVALLFSLIVTALTAVIGTLLVRFVVHLFNKKSRRRVSETVMPATTP
jgi:hypothetical protein